MYCESDSDDADLTVPYRVWQPIVRITVSDSLFVSNVASCSTCSGGGIAVQSGGVLSLIRTTVWNNTAGFFGGGLFLGGTSSGFSSCTLFTDGSGIGGNSALRGGAQLANSCGGNVTWSNTTVALANTTNEARSVICDVVGPEMRVDKY